LVFNNCFADSHCEQPGLLHTTAFIRHLPIFVLP
jgi:hypothetical protein